jgi:hypothetical protein
LLISGAVPAPGEEIHGATSDDLEALRARLGRDLPQQLAALLTVCNGARIGPGGLFGRRPDEASLDVPSILDLFPQWTDEAWIPVAGDGCVNYYVLLDGERVGFVDTMTDDRRQRARGHQACRPVHIRRVDPGRRPGRVPIGRKRTHLPLSEFDRAVSQRPFHDFGGRRLVVELVLPVEDQVGCAGMQDTGLELGDQTLYFVVGRVVALHDPPDESR